MTVSNRKLAVLLALILALAAAAGAMVYFLMPGGTQVLVTVGGGATAATAGAQVPGKTVDEVTKLLIQAIDQYLADE